MDFANIAQDKWAPIDSSPLPPANTTARTQDNRDRERAIKHLAYCLRAFLETCEEQYCPQWPLRTPGVPRYMAETALEYRRDRDGGRR